MSTRDSQCAHSSVLGAEAHSSALPMPSPASSLSPLLGSFLLWYLPILDHYQEQPLPNQKANKHLPRPTAKTMVS